MAKSQQQGSWTEANGRYTIRWRIRDDSKKSGWACRMRTLPPGTKQKAMLAALAAEVRRVNEVSNNPQPSAAGLTFKQFTDGQWARFVKSKRTATMATYDSLLKTWILPRIGEVPIAAITVAMMTELFADLKEQRAPSTVVQIYALLSNMFGLAEDYELIESVPLKRKRHRPKVPKSKKPAYPPEVIRRIVLAGELEDRAILWTYALTGLRAGEVPALQWQDIDFDTGLIHVRRKLYGRRVQPLKTDASEAPVPLPSILADVLMQHKASSRWTEPGDFVFVMLDGSPMAKSTLRYRLQRTLKNAGVPYQSYKTGFNLFRRSLATYLMKEKGLAQAQTQLRHGSATTTAAAYLCQDESVVYDNADVIESAYIQ